MPSGAVVLRYSDGRRQKDYRYKFHSQHVLSVSSQMHCVPGQFTPEQEVVPPGPQQSQHCTSALAARSQQSSFQQLLVPGQLLLQQVSSLCPRFSVSARDALQFPPWS